MNIVFFFLCQIGQSSFVTFWININEMDKTSYCVPIIKTSQDFKFYDSVCFFSLFNTLLNKMSIRSSLYSGAIDLSPKEFVIFTDSHKKQNQYRTQSHKHSNQHQTQTQYKKQDPNHHKESNKCFYVKNHLVQYNKLKRVYHSNMSIVIIENGVHSTTESTEEKEMDKIFEKLCVIFVDIPFMLVMSNKINCFNKPYPSLIMFMKHIFTNNGSTMNMNKCLYVCPSQNNKTDLCFCLNIGMRFCFMETFFMDVPIPNQNKQVHKILDMVDLNTYHKTTIIPIHKMITQNNIKIVAIFGNPCTGKTFFCSQLLKHCDDSFGIETNITKSVKRSLGVIFVNLKNNANAIKKIMKLYPNEPIGCIYVTTHHNEAKEREFIKHIKISKSTNEFEHNSFKIISFDKLKSNIHKLVGLKSRVLVIQVNNKFVKTKSTVLCFF